jgi:hypothetical protein
MRSDRAVGNTLDDQRLMINTFDEIIRAALALPPNSRAMLAEHLLIPIQFELVQNEPWWNKGLKPLV